MRGLGSRARPAASGGAKRTSPESSGHLTLPANRDLCAARTICASQATIPLSQSTLPRCGPNDTTCANPKPNGEKPGRTRKSSRPRTTTRARNITCSRCSPIRPGASTWAMCATTPWATWWRAIGARGGSTFSIRWAGTRSGCRPRTPPCRTTPVLRNGPTPISPPCGRNCSRWGSRSTGRARSRPAIRAITSTSRSCSSISSPLASSRARNRRSIGTRSTRRCSPTSR